MESSCPGENIFVAQALLRVLHLVDVGNHSTEFLQWSSSDDHIVSGIVLLERIISFLESASLAISGDEITMVVTLPSLRVIIGP